MLFLCCSSRFLLPLRVPDSVFYFLLLALIVVAFVQGGRALWRTQELHRSSVYLALFMVCVAAANFQLWFVFVKPEGIYPEVLLGFLPFESLPGPLFLLFVFSYLGVDGKINPWAWLLFLPFLVFSVGFAYMKGTVLMEQVDFKQGWKLYFPWFKWGEIINWCYAFMTIVVSYRELVLYERRHRDQKYDQVVAQTRWIKNIIMLGIGMVFIWCLALVVDQVSVHRWGNYVYLPAWSGFLLLNLYIGYTGFRQTSMNHQRLQLAAQSPAEMNPPAEEIESPSARTTLRHFEKLTQMMEQQRLFLNPQLDLVQVAQQVSLSPNYLSKIINTHAQMHFGNFVNTYRIQFAKHMLQSPEFESYNMLSIALEAGFNSKSAFYAAFKKGTGHAPGYFRSLVMSDSKS